MKKLSVIVVVSLFIFSFPLLHSKNESKELQENENKVAELNKFQKAILKQHNYYREIAGIPKMKWNKDIAENAEKWAQKLKVSRSCRMQHSSHSQRSNIGNFSYLGENLYWYYSSAGVSEYDQKGTDSVDSWYSEIEYFQYSKKGVVCSRRNGNNAIGHFTQLMWEKSTNLGCAYAICAEKSIVVVCQYGPGGNFNMRSTPPFSEEAAKRLDKHPINKKWGGLPRCDR